MVAHWAKQVTETCVTNVELTNVELGQLEVVFLKFGSVNFSELLSQLHAAARQRVGQSYHGWGQL